MFDIFMEESVISGLMVFFLAVSVGLQVLPGLIYQNMLRETDNMSTTDNKLLRQCKLKFANCYQLNNGVSNIPVFVDRFLNRLSLGHLSFDTMYHLSGQSILLSVICAGVGICRCIFRGKMFGEILPFYIVSFLGLYLYFSVSAIVDIKGKRKALKINLVDFLENHLAARINATEENMERLYGQVPGRNLRVAASVKEKGRRTVELLPIDGGLANRGVQRQGIREEPAEEKMISSEAPMSQDVHLDPEELECLLQEFLAT